MKRWLWLRLTRDGREERRAAREYAAAIERAWNSPEAKARWKQIRECGHLSRRPNPEATAIRPPHVAEICNDCGIGVVRYTTS